jgi:hypothetical protein
MSVEEFRAPGDSNPRGSEPAAEAEGTADTPEHTPPVLGVVADSSPKNRTPRQPRKAAASKSAQKKSAPKKGAAVAAAGKPSRQRSSFPASSFEEATEIATVMHKLGDRRIRRVTIFDELDRSPESGPSRQLITNSSRYGITTGSYKAEWIELTDAGFTATDPDAAERSRRRAQFDLAIAGIPPFKALHTEFVERKLPSQSVMRDFLADTEFARDDVQALIDTFIVNAKFVGVLKTISGAERLISIDHALDETPAGGRAVPLQRQATSATPASDAGVDWDKTCFYVTPIGAPDSDVRLHSDLFLEHLVAPALEEFGFNVVRADAIATPGMITSQIIEHLAKAKIVVADLSFHNPNVFYEVALRHARRLPIVQLIRSADTIPFDLNQFRTVVIDDGSLHTFVPQMETYRSEIANHVRQALADGTEIANPVTAFFPAFFPQ